MAASTPPMARQWEHTPSAHCRFNIGDRVQFLGGVNNGRNSAGALRSRIDLRPGDEGYVFDKPTMEDTIGCRFGNTRVFLRPSELRLLGHPKGPVGGAQGNSMTGKSCPERTSPRCQAQAGPVGQKPLRKPSNEQEARDAIKFAGPGSPRCPPKASSPPRRTSRGGYPKSQVFPPRTAEGTDKDVANGGDGSERLHPPSFYCPISQQCMHDPVVLTDGHTYERRHIEKWLTQNETSPVSGARLTHKTIVTNHALRNAIEEYFEQVLGSHRQAIRQATEGMHRQGNFTSNATLVQTIDSLMQCAILINANMSTEVVLKRIMNEAKSLLGAEAASVFLVDPERRELYSTVNSTGNEIRMPITFGVAGHVASTGNPCIVQNAYSDARFNNAVDSQTGFTTRNMVCVPIRSSNGGIIGVAELINKTDAGVLSLGQRGREDFTIEDQQFFQALASQAGAALANNGIRVTPGSGGWLAGSSPARTSRASSPLFYGKSSQGVRGDASGSTSSTADPSPGNRSELSFCTTPKMEDSILSPARFAAVRPLLVLALNGWDLDALTLAELTDNRPLSVLCTFLFEELGLVSGLNLDSSKMQAFFSIMERGYPESNQYHNRAHVTSVVHVMHALMSLGGVAEAASAALSSLCEDPERRLMLVTLAGLLAAVVHDFEHEGVTNEFLVKTSNHKALTYNDKSPNENHHVSAAFAVMGRPECNILEVLSATELRQVRQIVIDMVLATDMASNNAIVKSFVEIVEKSNTERNANVGVEASGAGVQGSGSPTRGVAFAPATAPEAVMALQMALKCADLGHLTLQWSSHVRWVHRLEAELFAQGDLEKKLGLSPRSAFTDREKPGVTDSQSGFINFVVLPVFRSMTGAFPQAAPVLTALEANAKLWKAVEDSRGAEP
eukprot:TRINITY_DN43600_c0_g1_i1.p1 TRINITY_DN43600_c0_g1~~TRINITY_DN43600_c0_g1_i1.p1  ORF type:complete len:899 (-),score=151.23 TRINITY_DN43600_c0_g1_i1:65-2761(-)